jgi:chromosome partitioning protein
MGRSVAVVCPKGGVGKTTVTVNLGAALADKGFKCLLIGIDPQCGVISSFGIDRFDVDYGLLDMIESDHCRDQVIQESKIDNLHFITSNVWSREEEHELKTRVGALPDRLRQVVADLSTRYDFIFLDCPPDLGALTFASLMAVDEIVIPLQAEELAYRALPRLFDALDDMTDRGQHRPEIMGIVMNQVSRRTRLSNSVISRVREQFGDLVFETTIPRTIRLAEVAQRGKPVNAFNRSGRAAMAFEQLADEILEKVITRDASEPSDTIEESAGETEMAGSSQVRVAALAADGDEDSSMVQTDSLPADIPDGELGISTDPGPSVDGFMERTDDADEERTISLDELGESEELTCSRSCPTLDDYDGGDEENYFH